MKRIGFCLAILFAFLAMPPWTLASRPVDYLMVGCVLDGMMFSLGPNASVGSVPARRAYHIRMMPRGVDLTPYEGKKIQVRGFLKPGDIFQPDLKTIKILGACDQESHVAVSRALPQAYRVKAVELGSQGNWEDAGKYINKAIQLDKSDCSLLLTRAQFYQQQGKITEALQDAQEAVHKGCNRYPDLGFLAELLESAGRKAAAILAYEQALAACEYKPDRERFEQSINRLKSHSRTESQNQRGQSQEGRLPPAATDPEVLPPPPPLPD